jgi:hypothetical protein
LTAESGLKYQRRLRSTDRTNGIPIVGTWVNRPQNEFIWVRSYKDKAELETKNKVFQAAVAAAGVKLGGNVAKVEVPEVESAFV